MSWEEIISHIPWAVGSGFIVAIGNYINNRKANKNKKTESDANATKSKADALNTLQNTWSKEFLRLEHSIDTMQERIDILEVENNQLRTQLRDLRSLHPEMPIPMSLKDSQGTILTINQAFEDAFLIPQGLVRNSVIGEHFEKMFSDETVSVIRDADVLTMSTKEYVEIDGSVTLSKLLLGWKLFKYPVYSQGSFVGIATLFIPKKILQYEA